MKAPALYAIALLGTFACTSGARPAGAATTIRSVGGVEIIVTERDRPSPVARASAAPKRAGRSAADAAGAPALV
ncbi:MAG: hypothetical protein NVSMB21_06010 [Vulcanimicrobiaceae bacterium]